MFRIKMYVGREPGTWAKLYIWLPFWYDTKATAEADRESLIRTEGHSPDELVVVPWITGSKEAYESPLM